MNLICLNNLNFSYRTSSGERVPVLKNINLTVGEGELIAIQGPSGSGKSTLLYIIGCLLSDYTGQVLVEGRDIALLSDEELAVLRNQRIGFVFQQFHLLPKATVWDNILLPARYPAEFSRRSNREGRALSLVKELGLEGRTKHFPNQLSGGQQQRVSIARALLQDTQIILADEPTGSLDTQNSRQIMDLLKAAHRSGRTVIIITHDPEIAAQCDKIVHFRDGGIVEIVPSAGSESQQKGAELSTWASAEPSLKARGSGIQGLIRVTATLLPLAFQSLNQNRSRSLLTMLGVVIGVAAVLSMITLGSFTKRKILDSYAEMGVNTFMFYGYPNGELRAIDQVAIPFRSFDWERDILPLRTIFPEIAMMSPTLESSNASVTSGGKTIESDVSIAGISADGLRIANRPVSIGTDISPYHVENRSNVCVIGSEIATRIFAQKNPLSQIMYIKKWESSYACRVIGVLSPLTSNKSWYKPNLRIYMPYTYLQGISNPWQAQIGAVLMQVRDGANVEATSKKIKSLFEMKYGKAGYFQADSDSVLLNQMKRFLSLFSLLLGAIAMVSLGVGGIGITNMMLVSVSERFKEIGIRKAFGATNSSIRIQYLLESVLICGMAGLVGLLLGFILYEAAILGATKLVPILAFEWTFDGFALLLSIVSILVVGILSGLTPAWKAEKLQVIEALRSE